MEEGRWSNQSFKANEQRRIYYIKEKKEKQRQEQMMKNQGSTNFEIQEEEEEHKNTRKRELKSTKNKHVVEDADTVEEIKKGKNFYKNKK